MLSLVVMAANQNKEQEKFDGKCPKIKPVEHLNETAFMGTWRESRKYGLASRCNRVKYTDARDTGGSFKFVRRYEHRTVFGLLPVSPGEFDDVTTRQVGWLQLVRQRRNKTVRATYKMTSDIINRRPSPSTRPNHNVLAHEEKYAIVWSCVNVKPPVAGGNWTNLQTLVILTRDKFPDSKVEQSAIRAVDDFQLDSSRLKKIDQTNCRKQKSE